MPTVYSQNCITEATLDIIPYFKTLGIPVIHKTLLCYNSCLLLCLLNSYTIKLRALNHACFDAMYCKGSDSSLSSQNGKAQIQSQNSSKEIKLYF